MHNLKEVLKMFEKENSKLIEDISTFIHSHPEISEKEYISSEFLTETLREQGFTIEMPICNLDTAFKATFGSSSLPSVAFLCEYDALPGYGKNGDCAHACGHNFIAASTLGVAIVLSKLGNELPFRVVVVGCPAEETIGSKYTLVSEKIFDDINIAMQIHPDAINLINVDCLALDTFEYKFTGKASHAAQNPESGLNALDAVTLTFMGMNCLREHLKSDVKMHGIITQGGVAPNIVPDNTSCIISARSFDRSYLNEVSERLFNVAKGAAIMTGTKVERIRTENPFDNMKRVSSLNMLMEQAYKDVGIQDIIEKDPAPASSDVGNVSYVVPTIYAYMGLNTDFTVHDKEYVDFIISDEAMKMLHQSVLAMAFCAIDVFKNDNYKKIVKEFNE